MDFYEVLDRVVSLLRARGKISYSGLKRQFDLDEDYLDDLKTELVEVMGVAADSGGKVLVWTGGDEDVAAGTSPGGDRAATGAVAATPRPAAPEQATGEAERRQLSVMFCDLVGSTALSQQLDPEDLREVVRAYQTTCGTVIGHLEGHVAQYLGDGLLVYFGYPRAHDDDVRRAVWAGLDILAAMKGLNERLERDYGVCLSVRVSVHTGRVVVGEMGGSGREEHLALGDAPNIAARLQGLAEPDTLVISEATQRLGEQHFVSRFLGAHELKGIKDPVRAFQVVEMRDPTRYTGVMATADLSPLIGRASELGFLVERWEKSKAGRGQVVLLSGEAGIGKSHLAEEIIDRVKRESCPRLAFVSASYYQKSAFHPVIDHLRRRLGIGRDAAVAESLGKLEAFLGRFDLPLDRVLPVFARLLSLPLEGDSPEPAPRQRHRRTLEAIADWLVAEADRQPTLAIWEDLHLADPSTLELLSLLIERAPEARLLSVLTFRPEFEPPWETGGHVARIVLRRLDRDDIETLIERMTGGRALAPEIVEQVVVKTDGVPLFVEELLKMILASGLVRVQGERYVLTGPLPPLAIPATLRDSLMARLDRLSRSRSLIQLCAVLGREFPLELVRAVSPLGESELRLELDRLVDAELLNVEETPAGSRLVFRHALVQDAAYESLLKSARQQYHRRAAEMLEQHFPHTVETEPEVLAHHYGEAGLGGWAAPYWRRAGRRAMERSALREAAACFEQALAALGQMHAGAEQEELAIDLRFDLRTVLMPLGELRRARDVLREAEALARARDDQGRLGWIAGYLVNLHWEMGEQEQATASGEQALEIATASGDDELRNMARRYLGRACHAVGDYRRAVELLEESCGAVGDPGAPAGRAGLASGTERLFLVLCLAELGAFAEGVAHAEEGVRIAEQLDRAFNRCGAYAGFGLLHLRKGDLEPAIGWLEKGLALCESANIPLLFPFIAGPLGLAYAHDGRFDEGLELHRRAVDRAVAMGRMVDHAIQVASLSEVYLLVGRLDEAAPLARQAMELAERYEERGYRAYALKLSGDVEARLATDLERGESYYRRALALAEELGMRPLEAHCRRGLGELHRRLGAAAEAESELAAANDLYRSMEMIRWLDEAAVAVAG